MLVALKRVKVGDGDRAFLLAFRWTVCRYVALSFSSGSMADAALGVEACAGAAALVNEEIALAAGAATAGAFLDKQV